MYQNLTNEKSALAIQAIMLNHLYSWLRLPMANLLDRNDIIRFCCSRSWQANHILKLLFAINQIEYIENYKHVIDDVDALPRRPPDASSRLMTLACSDDFRAAVAAGISLIRDSINLADIHYPQIKADAFFRIATNEYKISVTSEDKIRLAESIADVYKTIHGIEIFIVEGSLAKGTSDESSDVDLIAYCNFIPDTGTRKTRLLMIDEKSLVIPKSDRFTVDGVYVHVDFETLSIIEDTFSVFPQSICQTFDLWEPIQVGKAMWDPKSIFQEWKHRMTKTSQKYKTQLIAELSLLLQEEKRQFDISAQNDDLMYCSMVLGNILTIYFQLLGLINHQFLFFPKWMNYALQFMDYKPDDIHDRFANILAREINHDTLGIMTDGLQKLINELMGLLPQKKGSRLFIESEW